MTITNRHRWFKFILIAIPILFFVGLEGGLRLMGWFAPEPLFVASFARGQAVYQLNPTVGARYFDAERMTVPTLAPQTLHKDKPANTYRIFCLGGSTTAGFPFDAQVPFPHQLQTVLAQAYTEIEFEVINCGLSAINSFSVLDLLPELLDKEPDLILIYMGHNEFYGAYGSASAISIGRNGTLIRLALKLQHLHLAQVIRRAILAIAPAPQRPDDESLMEQVSTEQAIPLDSDMYRQTLDNYETNFGIIMEICREAGVPLMVGDLVSNVRDLPPFGNGDARIVYDEGVILAASGDSLAALAALRQAKDMDGIRFRASVDMNLVIRRVAEENGVPLIEIQAAFQQAAPQGLIGNDLMCDHLHPNPQGYFLMARAFFDAIQAHTRLMSLQPDFVVPDKPIGVTDLDWEIGYLKIFKMIHRWPYPFQDVDFNDYKPLRDPQAAQVASDYVLVHHDWKKAHYDMADLFVADGQFDRARAEYNAVRVADPADAEPFRLLGRTYMQQHRWADAETAYSQYARANPTDAMSHYQIAMAQYRQEKLEAALHRMQAAIDLPGLTASQQLNARFYLAGFLTDLHRYEEAKTVVRSLLQDQPNFPAAQKLLRDLDAATE